MPLALEGFAFSALVTSETEKSRTISTAVSTSQDTTTKVCVVRSLPSRLVALLLVCCDARGAKDAWEENRGKEQERGDARARVMLSVHEDEYSR